LLTFIKWRCICGRSHVCRRYLFIFINLILGFLSFGLIFIEEVWETQEPISFNSEVKYTILECILFGNEQLCEKGFIKTEYSLNFEGFIDSLILSFISMNIIWIKFWELRVDLFEQHLRVSRGMLELGFLYGKQMMGLLVIKRGVLKYNMSAVVRRLLID